jgi:dipeptidyl aminopeptidase/acylaminoacyl peptidase
VIRKSGWKEHKTMLRVIVTAIVVLLLQMSPSRGQTDHVGADAPLSIDALLQIGSVVGGGFSPHWSPDGRRIVFSSSLNDGGLVTVGVDGGFPTRMPIDLGGTGHFLSSNDPRWSPDGKWISYISTKSGAPELWLWSVENGSEIQLTDLGGRINSLNWSPDSKWIAFADDRYGGFDIWTVAVPGGEVLRLTDDMRYDVYPSWTPDSEKIVYDRMDDRWVDHEVLEISAGGGNPRLVVEETDFFDYGSGRTFGYPMVSPDGNTVLFRSHRSGWINYWAIPLNGGEPRPIAAEDADQSDASWSPDGELIVFVSNHNGTQDLRVVSAAGGDPRILVAPETGVCSSPEWSPDGRHISYVFGNPVRPNDLFVVSLDDGQRTQLTNSTYAGNLENALIAPEKITYPSADGLTISAYLYKPAYIRPGDRFPGILWIHGGPTSQFRDTFQQSVQFFAQRGYVLLLPNIRGSSGYGKDFEKLNNQCWGECDLRDALAGVEYLKTLPYVDPDNMGITGTSYGGDFTMASVGHVPPGTFQAAIAHSGEADWVRAYNEDEMRHVKLWDYEFGPLDENEELYRRLSPVSGIPNVTTPTFVVHGEGLYPSSELAELFASELERHYKVFRYKAYSPETFYVSSRKNRRQMLLDMLDFFDQFLKGSKTGN